MAWPASCAATPIAAVELWASDEKEAASRAVSKSLTMNYNNACLFFLLINLRYNRIDAAKKWYISYLENADMNDMGAEWQYLLQAYLAGAFGINEDFQDQVAACFKKNLLQVEAATANFGAMFSERALDFAKSYICVTSREYGALRKSCAQYDGLIKLLSEAEKNAVIARYYIDLAEADADAGEDLPQRIENVLYSLINNYDDEEIKIVKKLKYNEAVILARGDVGAAQAKYNSVFADQFKKQILPSQNNGFSESKIIYLISTQNSESML